MGRKAVDEKEEVNIEDKPKIQRLVRKDNIQKRLKDGWKIVEPAKDRKQIGNEEDSLTLMEK